jgi:hypothetical protein
MCLKCSITIGGENLIPGRTDPNAGLPNAVLAPLRHHGQSALIA